MEAVAMLPHKVCVLNDKLIITCHVAGDASTAIAYWLIPCAIIWTSWSYRSRQTQELRDLLLHGAAFIAACSATHVVDIWNWWHTDYLIAGGIKLLCGLVSLTFVWRMWKYLTAHPLKLTAPE